MAGNYMHVPGVKYIAGRDFDTSYGHHEYGKVITEATKFENLDVLVAMHYLYPYAPEMGYEYLPPHLFNDVQTKVEVKATLEGDPVGSAAVPSWADGKPDLLTKAEEHAEAQVVIYEKIQNPVQPRAPKPEPEEAPVAVKRTAAKKTAEPKG